jgi:hypothetical protein
VATCAGALAAYVGYGGLLGFILARNYAPGFLFGDVAYPPSCWPELGTFYDIGTRCVSAMHDQLWFIGLGLPRLAIALPVFLCAMATDAARSALYRNGSYLDCALPVLAFAWVSALELAIYRLALSAWSRALPWGSRCLTLLLAVEYGRIIYVFFLK